MTATYVVPRYAVRPILAGAACPSGNAAGVPSSCDWCPAPAVWDVGDGSAWCDHACDGCMVNLFHPAELSFPDGTP